MSQAEDETQTQWHLLQAYIDWKSIRENLEAVKANVANRNSNADPDKVIELYDRWRSLQAQAEELRTERNANAKAMKVRPISRQLLFATYKLSIRIFFKIFPVQTLCFKASLQLSIQTSVGLALMVACLCTC